MEDLGVDADHQHHGAVVARDVLGGVAQRCGAAELLETDQVPVFGAQVEEQIRPCLEAVIGTVVDDRGQVRCRGQDSRKVFRLGRFGDTA